MDDNHQNSQESGGNALPNEQGPTKKTYPPSKICRVSGCGNFKQAWTNGRCKSCHGLNLEPRLGDVYIPRGTKRKQNSGGGNNINIRSERINEHGEVSIFVQNEHSAATTFRPIFSNIGVEGDGGKGNDKGSTIASEQEERLETEKDLQKLHDLEFGIGDGDGDGPDKHGGNEDKGGESLKEVVERLENEIFNLKEKNAHLEEDVKILKSLFDSINDQFDKLASEKSTTTASIKDHISIRRMHQETMSGRLSLFKSSATEKDNSPTRQSHRNVRALPKGLRNNGLICFNNALLQSFASLRHLTTFMNDPPQYNNKAYPLNHAFCTILNLMSSQDEGQESTLDPSSFVDLFMKKHPKFISRESEFS
jgi:hypothetical protein